MTDNYVKNEIVWAKIKGFPWWPGVIAEVFDDEVDQPTEFLVNFIGDNSHAVLGPSKIAKYYQNYDEYSKCRNTKNLVDSIRIADKIIKGETTYEIEKEKTLQKKGASSTKSSSRAEELYKVPGDDQLSHSISNSSGVEQFSMASTQIETTKKKRGRPKKNAEAKSVEKSNGNHIAESKPVVKRAEMNAREVQYNYLPVEKAAPIKEEKPIQMQVNPMLFHQSSDKHSLVEAKGNFEFTIPSNTGFEIQTEDSSHQNGSDHLINGDIKGIEIDFASKSIELKQILTQLQKMLTEYPTTSNKNSAANAITNLIQECLTRLSIESLSPQELAEYLSNNMGKMLFVLFSLLEEFEKYLHQNAQILSPAIKKKKDGVQNLLATLKIRIINEYLEHGDFSKMFLEDFKRDIRRHPFKKDSPLPQLQPQLQIQSQRIEQIVTEVKSTEFKVGPRPLKNDTFDLARLQQGTPQNTNFTKNMPVTAQVETPKQNLDSKLRAKVCESIASKLEEKHRIHSQIAKERSQIIENKIYNTTSENSEYKNCCKSILKCITNGLITMESLIDNQPFDWQLLSKEANRAFV